MSAGMFWNNGASNEVMTELTAQEKELRDMFVVEFLKDHDYRNAAIRIGFLPKYADQYAAEFAVDPYVKRRIEYEMTRPLTNEEAAEHKRAMIRRTEALLLKQAGYAGPGASHGARVSALSKLASIYGMDAPTKVEQTIQHKGGVMMVPGVASVEDWEAAAVASQEKLTKEAEQ